MKCGEKCGKFRGSVSGGQRVEFELVFEDKVETRYLDVGCCLGETTRGVAGKDAKGGNYDIECDKLVVATPGKGAVSPGQVVKVEFRLQREGRKVDRFDTNILDGIGEWSDYKGKITLSGGYIPPNAPPTQVIHIKFKAYLGEM